MEKQYQAVIVLHYSEHPSEDATEVTEVGFVSTSTHVLCTIEVLDYCMFCFLLQEELLDIDYVISGTNILMEVENMPDRWLEKEQKGSMVRY